MEHVLGRRQPSFVTCKPSSSVVPRVDHAMCSWLIIVDMRQTEYVRVRNKTLKIAGISKSHLGLNISIKFNEMLIDALVIFLAFMGRLRRLRPEVI